MISLKDNRTALINLRTTVEALERIDMLIEHYSVALPDIAHVDINRYNKTTTEVQLSADILVTALEAQRERLTEYLASLGIDAGKRLTK
jgi:hypothetical protein